MGLPFISYLSICIYAHVEAKHYRKPELKWKTHLELCVGMQNLSCVQYLENISFIEIEIINKYNHIIC